MLIKHRHNRPIKQESLLFWLLESWQGGNKPPCCAFGLNYRNCLLIAKMKFLGGQGYFCTVRETQDLTSKGRKTGVFFRAIRIVHIIQKPRKWLKTVLFSTFGLLESPKKAVKKRFNTSLKRHFAKS